MSLRNKGYQTLSPERPSLNTNCYNPGTHPAERAHDQPGDPSQLDDAGPDYGDHHLQEPSNNVSAAPTGAQPLPGHPLPSIPSLPGILRQVPTDTTYQPASLQLTDDRPHTSADVTYLPPNTSESANHEPPCSSSTPRASRDPTPQPSPQPLPEPAPRKSTRVKFKPQPLVVGDPNHRYWQAHHSRPRIPTPRGEGR